MRFFFSFILFFFTLPLYCSPLSESVEVTLINPVYRSGTLSTEEGGVVIGPQFRLQARKILYTKSDELHCLSAEGDLLIEYEGSFLRGESLFYDFKRSSGSISCARSTLFPWTFGGDELLLCSNGDIAIIDGWISPETEAKKLLFTAKELRLTRQHILKASGISVRLGKQTLFALPALSLDLSTTDEIPFSLRYGWHGFLGSYLGLRYHFLSLGDLKGFARIDGYFGHGLGGGIETTYCPCSSPTRLYTRSYYAKDIAISDPKRRDRYRFQGTYSDLLFDKSTSLNMVYDKVSDAEMASDYINDDFNLETAERTELLLHQANCHYTSNFFTRFKLNSFQTINQELPTFEMTLHPWEIAQTGIVAENIFRASYLNFSFSDEVIDQTNFHSGRIEVRPHLYRPFSIGALKMMPEATFIGIYYTNNDVDEQVGQALFDLGLQTHTSLYRRFGCIKHVVEPYGEFHYLTPPRSSLNDHFIFTIDDAYNTLQILRFGTKHLFFTPICEPPLILDLFANAFFDTKTMGTSIPKGYLLADLALTPKLALRSFTGWNFSENTLDFTHARIDWTLSEDVAIGTEYRHRSRFDWRKADFYNFLLESVRSTDELLASPLSDQNDILLLRLFCRITPDLTAKLELREGWHRPHQPSFTEYQIEAETPLFENFRLTFTYEKRESDNRFLVSVHTAPGPP